MHAYASSPPLAPAGDREGDLVYQWWCLLPFAAMLASIAIAPIAPATQHWWEKRSSQLLVALVLGIPTTLWMWWTAGSAPLVTTAVDYLQFICLLFALFVVSGGIHLAGDIRATPAVNTAFLGIGAVLASLIGTTGAAMLLIRPLLATNRERVHRVHTVLFAIFVVANCGGLLTPLGDPPLFLGFLHGVPFTWTLGLWKEWLFVVGLLLLTYWSIDTARFATEPPLARLADATEIEPLRLRGAWNLALLGVIVASVAFLPSWDAEALAAGEAHGWGLVPVREIVMLGAAAASYLLGDREVRFGLNAFSWAPISEVATLFIGIFATMAPALAFLEQVAPSLPLNRVTFFLFTGSLSSVLDNAPTYLTFFEMAASLPVPEGTAVVAGVPELFLVSISLGAVLCGAITYIGNGPNFMVKSVAESDGVEMPSFGGYVVRAVEHLVPVLAAMALVFIAPGTVWHVLGWVLVAVLVGLAAWRVVGARRVARTAS